MDYANDEASLWGDHTQGPRFVLEIMSSSGENYMQNIVSSF